MHVTCFLHSLKIKNSTFFRWNSLTVWKKSGLEWKAWSRHGKLKCKSVEKYNSSSLNVRNICDQHDTHLFTGWKSILAHFFSFSKSCPIILVYVLEINISSVMEFLWWWILKSKSCFSKNQHTQSKLLYFENTMNGSLTKSVKTWLFKVNILCQESSNFD